MDIDMKNHNWNIVGLYAAVGVCLAEAFPCVAIFMWMTSAGFKSGAERDPIHMFGMSVFMLALLLIGSITAGIVGMIVTKQWRSGKAWMAILLTGPAFASGFVAALILKIIIVNFTMDTEWFWCMLPIYVIACLTTFIVPKVLSE